jgi:hypothetical protein
MIHHICVSILFVETTVCSSGFSDYGDRSVAGGEFVGSAVFERDSRTQQHSQTRRSLFRHVCGNSVDWIVKSRFLALN